MAVPVGLENFSEEGRSLVAVAQATKKTVVQKDAGGIRAHFFIHRQPLPPPFAAVAGRLRGSLPSDSRGTRTAPPRTAAAAAEEGRQESKKCGGSTCNRLSGCDACGQ